MSIAGLKKAHLRCVGRVFPRLGWQAVTVPCGESPKEGMHELLIRRQREGYNREREIRLPILRVAIQFGRMPRARRVLSQTLGKISKMNLKEKIFADIVKKSCFEIWRLF